MSVISLPELPVEVLVNIFVHLQIGDLRNVMRTCKTFRSLVLHDTTIWKNLSRGKLIIQRSSNTSKRNLPISPYHNYRDSHNWRYGIYKHEAILKHNENYMPWIQYEDNRYLLVTVGLVLKCVSLENKSHYVLWKLDVPKVFRGDIRTNDISRFILKNNILACGNRDGCVAVYRVNNIREKPTFLKHIEDCHEDGAVEVSSVEIINKHLPCVITASSNSQQLKFWHWECNDAGYDARDITLFESVGLRCLAVDEAQERVAVGPNGSDQPVVLDVETGAHLATPAPQLNMKRAVRDVQWRDAHTVVYVTHSGLLQCLDLRADRVVYKVTDPFQCSLYCVKTDGRNAIVVGSSEYSRCVLFDVRNAASHVQMYFTQKKCSPIYSLDFDTSTLVAAADRSVTALRFNSSMKRATLRDYSQPFEVVRR